MDDCIRLYPIACRCNTCTHGDTHNQHLRHFRCVAGPDGHLGAHRFILADGTEVSVDQDRVIIGRVTTGYPGSTPRVYGIWAWRNYGVVIPGWATTNGVIRETAEHVNCIVEQGGSWEGPGEPGPGLAEALRVEYLQIFTKRSNP